MDGVEVNVVKFNYGYVLIQNKDNLDEYMLALKDGKSDRYVTLIKYKVHEETVEEIRVRPVAKLYCVFARINMAMLTGKKVVTNDEFGYDYNSALVSTGANRVCEGITEKV